MRALLVAVVLGACRAPEPVDWTTVQRPPAPADEPREPIQGEPTQAPEPAGLLRDEVELRHGIALVEQGDLAGGATALEAALAAAPKDSWVSIEAQRWLGHVHTRAGDPEAALERYRLALGGAPGDPWLHYACGVSWNTMGERERALGCFTRAVELDPGHFKALQWRGEIRLELGDVEAALDDLTRALACIESADDAAIARAASDRRSLLLMTLALRIEALAALGRHAAAADDRARRAALLEGP